ncbi:MAG TPA: hypothetical protein VFU46_13845 [Gemmatimonadales bacterium]|nr:hypothetical protein [Gemmatimonadales bacterium]
MSVRNHELTYRPVQGGVLVINPANQRPGTLGAIVSHDGTDRLALSCYHVLCRPNGGPFADGEPVLQSLATKGGTPIGRVFIADSDAALDIAAARIDPGIQSIGRILGLDSVGEVAEPAVGMRVVKAGAATGITEGEIARVQGDRVEIRRPTGYASVYEVSDFGDSGAIWIDQATRAPVAMHSGGSPQAMAIAVRLAAVLTALSLSLVRD